MNKYEIERLLGEGANGTVHLAHQRSLGRSVALKRLSATTDTEASRRFMREARLLATLSHPNVVRVYEVGEEDGVAFLAMEYVEGATLAELIRQRSPRVTGHAEAIFAQLMEALAHLHEQSIAHRDVKPHNVMLDHGDRVKLVDFGLVKSEKQDTTALTEVGYVLGTVPYMAPEVFEGELNGVACDLWAAGCVYYELITGERAFPATTTRALISTITTQQPIKLAGTDALTRARQALLDRMLEKDPDRRFKSAREVLDALQPLLDGEPAEPVTPGRAPGPVSVTETRRLPTKSASAFLALLTGLGLVAWFGLKSPPPPQVDPLIPVVATLRRHETERAAWELEAGEIKPHMYSFAQDRLERGRASCQRLVADAQRRIAEVAVIARLIPPHAAPDLDLMRATVAARTLMLKLQVDRMSQIQTVFDAAINEKLDSLFGAGRLLQLDDAVQYDPALLQPTEEYFDISKNTFLAAAQHPDAALPIGLALADQLFMGRQWNPYRFRGPTEGRFKSAVSAYLSALSTADTPAIPLGTCAARLFTLGFRGEQLRDPKAVQIALSELDRLAISLPGARAELDLVAGHVRSMSSAETRGAVNQRR